MADIYSFIYTKVKADQSPWKKNGFQTLYYSVEVIEKKTLLDIESRIHYPGDGYTHSKTSVCWIDIKGELYQMIQFFTPLNEMVDEFGRKGMFMVQGFLLPSQIWKVSPEPFATLPLLKKHRIITFEDIFTLPGLDKATGNLAAIQMNPAELPSAPHNLPQITQQSVRALEVIWRQSSGEQDLALVVNGQPDAAAAFFNQLLAYLPEAYRIKAGFDSGFDGGKIFFFPLRVLAYSQNAPVTGDPVMYNLESGDISANAPDPLLRPFMRWIATHAPSGQAEIEHAAILSNWLQTNQSLAPEEKVSSPLGFGKANIDIIRDAFGRKAAESLGKEWSEWIGKNADGDWLLDTLLANLPNKEIALEMEDLIQQAEKIPFSTQLPGLLEQHAGPIAKAIHELQTTKKVSQESWNAIPAHAKAATFSHIKANQTESVFNVFALLSSEETKMLNIAEDKKLKTEALAWMKKQVKEPVKELGDPLFTAVLVDGNLRAVEAKKVDWAKMLEAMLITGELDTKDISKVIQVASDQGIPLPNDHLLALMMAEHKQIPLKIAGSPDLRMYMLAVKIIEQEMPNDTLQEMGFTSEEIRKGGEWRPRGIKKLFRKIFG